MCECVRLMFVIDSSLCVSVVCIFPHPPHNVTLTLIAILSSCASCLGWVSAFSHNKVFPFHFLSLSSTVSATAEGTSRVVSLSACFSWRSGMIHPTVQLCGKRCARSFPSLFSSSSSSSDFVCFLCISRRGRSTL